MLNIRQFFSRIQGAHAQELVFRTTIQHVIKKHISIEIPLGDISIKNGVVTINNSNGSLKTAIFIKKTALLKDMNDMQSTKKIADIR